jgi:hypothetical protein
MNRQLSEGEEAARPSGLAAVYVSPRYTREKLASGSLEDQIDIFEDRIFGWWLNPVSQVLTDFRTSGALALLVSSGLIETYEIINRGQSSEKAAKQFFVSGFERIFQPEDARDRLMKRGQKSSFLQEVATFIHRYVRSGLVHTAATKRR